MLRIFKPTDKTYISNGDKIIQPTKATVHKEDNGDYYLDFACGTQYREWIQPGNIIVADTPQGAQPFRIMNPEITHTKITCKCYHVFYDAGNYLIADSFVVDSTCNQALDHLNTATEPASPFRTVSDVPAVNSFRCVRKSLYEAVQTVLERWGGHLVRDGWTIGIRQDIGADNGVVVRYGKNLESITASYDWSNVCTKILPEGSDGLLLNALDASQSIYMEAATQYDLPYCKTVQFSQPDIKQDDYKTADGKNDETAYKTALLADLRAQAQAYLNEHCVPAVNYKMEANLEKVTDVGDKIEVMDERLGLDLLTRVISFEYDTISGRYTSIEFGTFQQTLSNLMGTVQQTAQDAAQAVNDRLTESENKINNIFSGSYVIYDGEQILVVDSLPKESARNVLRINSAGIGFSSSGINGDFTSAWTIDGTLNKQYTAASVYPVGSIYLSVDNTDPAALFGGTWERIGGRFLLGADSTYAAGSTGGEAEHTLTIDEMPKHNHEIDNLNASGNATPYMTVSAQDKKGYGGNVQTMYTGGSKPHNNMPPYLAVYMWRRTA